MVGEGLRTFSYGLLTALFAMGVVGCSSADDVEETPAVGDRVNTHFVLSVSTNNSASTRMSSDNTQSEGNFRGIDNTYLLGYKLPSDGQQLTTATSPSKIYDLGDLLAANTISASAACHVIDLDIELYTNTLLFYGKAIKDGTDLQQGKIEFHVGDGGSDTYFMLQPRVSDAEAFTNMQTALEDILDIIPDAWAGYGTKYIDPNQVGTLNALEKTLGEAYATLAIINADEARAGSGTAILRMIDDLYKYIQPITSTSTSNDREAAAKAVAVDIISRINSHFEYVEEKLQFKDYDKDDISLSGIDLEAFPTNMNIPAGAIQLKNEGGFKFVSGANLGMGAGTPVANIMWPAELCYYGNSPIRTSTVIKNKEDFPQTIPDWNDDDNVKWSSFEKNSMVLPNTRTVAMQNDINYGTALLETKVKYDAEILNDNNSAIHTGEPDNTIDAKNSPFELTGILVGGQYKKVGWDYLPVAGITNPSSYVIYDNALPSGTIPAYNPEGSTSASEADYTLVFDNKSAEDDKSVFICLEFKNNSGKDFYGNKNLIAKGETFYLIGKLQMDAAQLAAHGRVFIQDHVTRATFKIGANSLKYAFVTVPDLHITETSLGLAVDISWSDGPEFEIELGN